jgi:hypothetical protein
VFGRMTLGPIKEPGDDDDGRSQASPLDLVPALSSSTSNSAGGSRAGSRPASRAGSRPGSRPGSSNGSFKSLPPCSSFAIDAADDGSDGE